MLDFLTFSPSEAQASLHTTKAQPLSFGSKAVPLHNPFRNIRAHKRKTVRCIIMALPNQLNLSSCRWGDFIHSQYCLLNLKWHWNKHIFDPSRKSFGALCLIELKPWENDVFISLYDNAGLMAAHSAVVCPALASSHGSGHFCSSIDVETRAVIQLHC